MCKSTCDSEPLLSEQQSDRFGFVELRVYVLFILTVLFMLAHITMWLLAVTTSDMQIDQDWGRGDGTGTQYDLLAGPLFCIMYILSTLCVGFIVDKQYISRESFLAISCLIWSTSAILTGYSTTYWQIVIYRMISGMSIATTQPLSVSIISDFYTSKLRASAMAIFNSAVYIAFCIAYGLGNYITEQYSWRYSWYIFGYIGCCTSLIVFCLPKYKEPIKPFLEIPDVETANRLIKTTSNTLDSEADIEYSTSNDWDSSLMIIQSDDSYSLVETNVTIKSVIKYYIESPSLIILLFASLYLNCVGYIWGYNANNFLENEKGENRNEIASALGWIPVVAGSIGSLFGAALSDRFIESTITIRISVLIVTSLISGTFAALMLYLDPPYGYCSLFCMYLFSETWIPITVTIVAELCPENMKSSLLSVYYFIIACAGFSPQLVTPIDDHIGYFGAIFILWPGIYFTAPILFLAVIFTFKKDLRKRSSSALSY